MDELEQYLKFADYTRIKLEQILNKKIIITKVHIDIIEIKRCCYYEFDIIKIFEKYGYVFTNDDYIMLVDKCGYALKFISNDKRTDEICKIAVGLSGCALTYISENKKTDEICKIAVQQNRYALTYVPANKKYLFIKK